MRFRTIDLLAEKKETRIPSLCAPAAFLDQHAVLGVGAKGGIRGDYSIHVRRGVEGVRHALG